VISLRTPETSATLPCLTADPAGTGTTSSVPNCNLASPHAVGAGALRFTGTSEQTASAVVYATSIPTTQGLNITFQQYQYGGYGLGGPGNPGGADGISFFLAAAPPTPATLGQQGGALGYATDGSSHGLPGGWLGIGLDAFGNFANPGFNHASCPTPAWATGGLPDEITVRGPGNGTDGYCLLSSSVELGQDDPIGPSGVSLRAGTRAESKRAVQVIIDPITNTYTVNIDTAGGTNFVLATTGPLPTSYYDPETGNLVNGLPPRITFGFGASTGSATDIHEINSLVTETLNGGVPELSLTKTNNVNGSLVAGGNFTYQLTPGVVGTVAEDDPTSIRVEDVMPAGTSLLGTPSGNGWNCSSTSAAFRCTYLDGNSISPGTSLPSIFAQVLVDGNIPTGTHITNTATVVSDDAALPASASDTITIAAAPPPLTITTSSLPAGEVGVNYVASSLAASGGTGSYTWTISAGSLPAGILLSTTGAFSGSPNTAGTANFTVRVSDGSTTATRALSINVVPALAITTASLPNGEVGFSYSAPALASSGGIGAKTWTVASGTLPGNLSLSTTGVFSGTPSATGTANFSVRVTDALGGTGTKALSITIVPALSVTTNSLPGGTVNVAYSAPALAASGGSGALNWARTAGTLPAGLTLSAAGVFSGTPTAAGTSNFTVRVIDALGGTATKALSIMIVTALTITTASLPPGEVGVNYSAPALTAAGGSGPLNWSLAAGGLPTGLSLSASGVISGAPGASGTFNFTARVMDGLGRTATKALSITIVPTIAVTTTSLPAGQVGISYSAPGLAASGGTGARIWSIASGSLPTGLSLSTAGLITGSPTTAGISNFTVRVIDGLGATATKTLSITIANPAIRDKAYLVQNGTCAGAFSCAPSTLFVVDLNNGATLKRITLPTRTIPRDSVATPDGSRVLITTTRYSAATGETWSVILIFDATTDTLIQQLNVGGIGETLAHIEVSSDGSRFYVALNSIPSSTVEAWDLRTMSLLWLQSLGIRLGGVTTGLSVSPDGRGIFVALASLYWDPNSRSNLFELDTNNGSMVSGYSTYIAIKSMTVARDNKTVYAAGEHVPKYSVPSGLVVINTQTKTEPGSLRLGRSRVFSHMFLTPDGQTLAGLDRLGRVFLIQTSDLTIRRRIQVGTSYSTGLTQSPEGNSAYVSADTGLTRLNLASGAKTLVTPKLPTIRTAIVKR
jgi:hypothetical protein